MAEYVARACTCVRGYNPEPVNFPKESDLHRPLCLACIYFSGYLCSLRANKKWLNSCFHRSMWSSVKFRNKSDLEGGLACVYFSGHLWCKDSSKIH